MKRHRRTISRGAGGFTLVEVLATLVLIGIVLPVAMQGISIAMRAGSSAKRTLEAASLADAKLAELVATREWELNVVSGDFGEEWREYRWEAEIITRGDANVTELVVTTYFYNRGVEQGVSVGTLVYVPAETTEVTGGTGGTTGGGP